MATAKVKRVKTEEASEESEYDSDRSDDSQDSMGSLRDFIASDSEDVDEEPKAKSKGKSGGTKRAREKPVVKGSGIDPKNIIPDTAKRTRKPVVPYVHPDAEAVMKMFIAKAIPPEEISAALEDSDSETEPVEDSDEEFNEEDLEEEEDDDEDELEDLVDEDEEDEDEDEEDEDEEDEDEENEEDEAEKAEEGKEGGAALADEEAATEQA